ncbi:MAG: M15 family metallopeptidase [Eubacteriales bacterium]|nr:M15 family metallopeptidase [Eubacteriales bacterium]
MRRALWRTLILTAFFLFAAGAASLAFTAMRLTARTFAAEESDAGNEEASARETLMDQSGTSSGASAQDGASGLLLVNKTHPLEEDYEPELVRLRDYGVEVDASIYEALTKMLAAGEQKGLSFWVASAYRSPQRQRELLDEDIGELVAQGYSYSEAYEEVVRETMPVGCSEHATGLAVDIVSKGYQILDAKQADTAEIRWLQENCSQYGFILRYPDGKEEITSVSYESWHFRYVGEQAAKAIAEHGITLEEYLEETE